MTHPAATAPERPLSPPGVAHSHFDVRAEPPDRQFLAWRARVGHVMDALPSRDVLDRPFNAAIDRYDVGGLVFTECRADALVMERSLARVSTDSVRDFAFHVFEHGRMDDVRVRAAPRALRKGEPPAGTVTLLALDMNQPVRLRRSDCRVHTFFVPGALVQETFPDPEALHGRMLACTTPAARLAAAHAISLARHIGGMTPAAAQSAVRTGAQLAVSAFGKQAGFEGNARAAARAAMFDQVRRHVQTHLHRADLTPESVLAALQLPRPTLYRMFQHEGGLGSYIRGLRLRQAASDLARYPHVLVTDVAYGAGFGSASDFSRAFRRAYGIAPQDFRVQALERRF
ncbi:helix-turn-helix transcriptional regulator [Variovorax sp. EBFNA2]|uniref:helix-turn-helix transcriptional regulator n=1 Tax=Variovorax sp. EBFNA2 TaxID=3342097 RepID=UPI0029C00196|nr:helix-turn-helix transcriptional regulator [Variovorax boronicumulans]WPG39354.1 helix-turn-helix transcriptional regulator [Variovorax boronicumulans]